MPFSRSAGQAAERQKAPYLFEVRRLLIVNNNNALDWAAMAGHAAIVDFLINKGADINGQGNKGEWT